MVDHAGSEESVSRVVPLRRDLVCAEAVRHSERTGNDDLDRLVTAARKCQLPLVADRSSSRKLIWRHDPKTTREEF